MNRKALYKFNISLPFNEDGGCFCRNLTLSIAAKTESESGDICDLSTLKTKFADARLVRSLEKAFGLDGATVTPDTLPALVASVVDNCVAVKVATEGHAAYYGDPSEIDGGGGGGGDDYVLRSDIALTPVEVRNAENANATKEHLATLVGELRGE